jgi:hypothetical protein
MKNIFLITVFISFIFLSQVSLSQSISNQVISNSGENFKGESISLNWTLGESVNDMLIGESFINTQGFHQTYLVNAIVSNYVSQPPISVYPNPVKDFIHIKMDEVTENVVVELYDLAGKKLYSEKINTTVNIKMDMKKYAAGKYLLHVITDKKIIYSIIKLSN